MDTFHRGSQVNDVFAFEAMRQHLRSFDTSKTMAEWWEQVNLDKLLFYKPPSSLISCPSYIQTADMTTTHNFPELKNDLILRAARKQKTERSPVWVMRQAGRYLPEFREMRKKHEFFEICRNPELACEITLQPLRRYAGLLDAAIIFSDILVIPQAMGMVVEMLPAQGPHFPNPIVTLEDAQTVLDRTVDTDTELDYVYKALTLTRHELKGQVPLIGFCGAPWTLFAYMIEGGGSKTFQKAKTWLWNQPEISKKLLSKIADIAAQYLVGQIRAGAQLVQVFDSWAGELTPRDFQQFSLPYLKQISSAVRSLLAKEGLTPVPMIVFAKGANGHALNLLADAGYDVVGLDWTVSAAEARKIVGGRCALQGNLDPSLLYADKEALRREVKVMFSEENGFGTGGSHIANLGHGITPAVDPETMRCFLESVHEYSAAKL